MPLLAATLYEEIRQQQPICTRHDWSSSAMSSAADRLLGTRLGAEAVTALSTGEVGVLIGLSKGTIQHIRLADAVQPCSKVDEQLYGLAAVLAR